MKPWLIGYALSPFFALLLIALVGYPVRRLIERRMRDGRLKRLLLRRIRT